MSIYGERHKIFHDHHVETKAKLDSLLAKNTEIEVNNDQVEAKLDTGNASLASVDGKVTACNTADVTVSACALPTDGSKESKQDTIIGHLDGVESLITATNSVLAGTLTVSAPAVTKTASTPVSSQAISGQAVHLTSEIDLGSARHLTIFGSSSDTVSSHEFDLFVSNTSGGTYYKTSHSGYYLDGNVHLLLNDIPYKYVKLQIKNGDGEVGNTADFTLHLVQSD